jgi:hypothetical protein
MSIVVKLMIGGWATTFAMYGFFALDESGKLLEIRERIALWLETLADQVRIPEEGMEPGREDAA